MGFYCLTPSLPRSHHPPHHKCFILQLKDIGNAIYESQHHHHCHLLNNKKKGNKKSYKCHVSTQVFVDTQHSLNRFLFETFFSFYFNHFDTKIK